MKSRTKVLLVSGLALCGAVLGVIALEAPAPPEPVAVQNSAPQPVDAPHAPPAAAVPVAAPAPGAVEPSAESERQLFAQAESLLFSNPSQAMDLLRSGDAQFPRGALSDQRQLLKLRARVNLNQIPEARVDATEYLELNPRSPIAAQIHQLLGIHPPPEMGPPRQ